MIDGISSSQTILPTPASGPASGTAGIAFSSVMSDLAEETVVPTVVKNTLASIGYVHDASGYHSADGLSVLAGFDGSQESIDYIADLQARLASERAVEEVRRAAWHQAYPNGTPQMQSIQAQAKVVADERVAQWQASGVENSFAMVGSEPVQVAAAAAQRLVARVPMNPTTSEFAGVQTHVPTPRPQVSHDEQVSVVVAEKPEVASLSEMLQTSVGKEVNLVDQLLEQLFQSQKV